jgi:hypothetical protein
MRRVARVGDGWIASAYNLPPAAVPAAPGVLADALRQTGRTLAGFPCSLATDAEALRDQLLIGAPEHRAAVLQQYELAGIERVFIWGHSPALRSSSSA